MMGLRLINGIFLLVGLSVGFRKLELCPKHIAHKEYFDVKKIFGIWYSHYRTKTQGNQTLNCVRSHVRDDVDDGLYIKTYYQFPKNNSIVIQRAKIYGLESSGYFRTRKLVWKYEKIPRKYSEHWVIDTDYKSYRISFNCKNLTSYGRVTGSQQILLLQTRTKYPTRGLIEKLKGIATKAGLSIEHAFRVDHRNCPLRF